MRRTLTLAALIAASLLALAPAGALAKTYTVDVGPPGRLPAHLDFDAFFPLALTVHVGDSVRFQIMGFHDVAYLPRGMTRPPLVIPDSAPPQEPSETPLGRRSGLTPHRGLSSTLWSPFGPEEPPLPRRGSPTPGCPAVAGRPPATGCASPAPERSACTAWCTAP